MSTSSTYIVQIFSAFAPPELRPLLVRLDPDATVAQCIQAALNQYLERVPLMVLPSDSVQEYTLAHATAEGHPVIPPLPVFDSSLVLRQVPTLEFPYMLVLAFTPLRRDSQPHDDDTAAVASTAQLGGGGRTSAAARYPARQQTLSLAEKKAREEELREMQSRREENVRLIERRRMDKEREAFQHSETYEVLRQETQKKAEEEEERKLLAMEVAAEEARLRDAALAKVAEEAAREDDPVLRSHKALAQHRQDMLSSVEAEKTRLQEIARRREERAEQERLEALRVKQERNSQWKREQQQRMAHSLNNLLDDLDAKIAADAEKTQQLFEQERYMRKDVERIAQELRGIAQLETLRHVPKIADRQSRVQSIQNREEYEMNKTQLALDYSKSQSEAQEARQHSWATEEAKRKEALVSKLELEYRASSLSGNNTNNNRTVADPSGYSNAMHAL